MRQSPQQNKGGPGPWPFVLIGGLLAGGIAIAIFASAAARRRKAAMLAHLEGLGWSHVAKPAMDERESAWRSSSQPGELKGAAKRITWTATRDTTRGAQRLFEHVYVVSTGKSHHAVIHSVATLGAPHSWPRVEVRQENVIDKIAGAIKGPRGLQVEDPAFNARWHVVTDHQDFALLVLTPEVQAILMTQPKNTRLYVAAGAITLTRRARLQAHELIAIADALLAIREAIPGELDGWGVTAQAPDEATPEEIE